MLYFENVFTQLNENSERTRNRSEVNTPMNCSSWVYSQYLKHNWVVVVEKSFFADSFNLYGIVSNDSVEQRALQIILDENFENNGEILEMAERIFMQVHARYIMSSNGLQAVRRKYESGVFGICPRFLCEGQHLLPYGSSPVPNVGKACGWCPKCNDVYRSDLDIDGAYFGPSFPHFFTQMLKDTVKTKPSKSSSFQYFGIETEKNSDLIPKTIPHANEDI